MTETLTPAAVGADLEAERAVLAACLNDVAAIGRARRTLTPESFWLPAHRALFAAMLAVDDANEPVTPYAVYEHFRQAAKLATVDGGSMIHALFAYPFLSAGWAVGRVGKLARQRDRAEVARRFAQVADDMPDPDDAADQWARLSVQLEALIDEPDESEPVPGLSTWDEFLAQPAKPSDSVVPGLLDRQEVVMILASPGVGKSWLSRQVSLTVASGLHPFAAGRRIPPVRTLLIDLENPESTVQRQTQAPASVIAHLAEGDRTGDRAWIWRYPAGLNIRKRVDAALLCRVVDETRPDLVCIGSLYNLFARGRDDWDTAAEETIAVLNKIRARNRCALWIEHHMPKPSGERASRSPFGSSLWERWPSYGRVISRIGGDFYDLTVFRGDREAGREWPAGLQRGGGKLPWTPVWEAEELELIRENFQ